MTSAAAPHPSSSLPKRPPHTMFCPSATPIRDMKAWTNYTLYPAGSVVVDFGAYRVLSRRDSGGRLLPAGVLGVIGKFASGQAVRIVIPNPATATSTHELSHDSSAPGSSSNTRPGTPDGVSHADLSKVPTREYTEDDVLEVGRGLANYNWEQVSRVKGLNSSHIPQLIGYADSDHVVENITIRVPPSST